MEALESWLRDTPRMWVAHGEMIFLALFAYSIWVFALMQALANVTKRHLESLSAEATAAHDAWVDEIRETTFLDELRLLCKEEWDHRLLQFGIPLQAYLWLSNGAHTFSVATVLLAFSSYRFARAHAAEAVAWWQYFGVQGVLGIVCCVLYLKAGGMEGNLPAGFIAALLAHLLWNRIFAPLTMRAVSAAFDWRGLD